MGRLLRALIRTNYLDEDVCLIKSVLLKMYFESFAACYYRVMGVAFMFHLGCVWIKNLVKEKENERDPMVHI